MDPVNYSYPANYSGSGSATLMGRKKLTSRPNAEVAVVGSNLAFLTMEELNGVAQGGELC